MFTFVGDPTSVVEAALAAAKVKMEMFFIANVIFVVSPTSLVIIFNFTKVAFARIDMRKHTGEHPRFLEKID